MSDKYGICHINFVFNGGFWIGDFFSGIAIVCHFRDTRSGRKGFENYAQWKKGGTNVAPEISALMGEKTTFGGWVGAVGNSIVCLYHNPRSTF